MIIKRRNPQVIVPCALPRQEAGVGWLYILAAGEAAQVCKVGISRDLAKRFAQFSAKIERRYPVRMHCAFRLPFRPKDSPLNTIESTVQARLFSWALVFGIDWFVTSPSHVEEVVTDCIRRRLGSDFPIIRIPEAPL